MTWTNILVRLQNGTLLLLEVKGQDSEQQTTKWRFLDEYVRAVNQHGEFGSWAADVSRDPSDVKNVPAKHSQ